MTHIHMMVHGIVQGVGFRFYTMQKAYRYKIKGWVRNNRDGSVEIDAQGNQDDIARFIGEIKKGNGVATVESVDIQNVKEMKNYESFDVVYL